MPIRDEQISQIVYLSFATELVIMIGLLISVVNARIYWDLQQDYYFRTISSRYQIDA